MFWAATPVEFWMAVDALSDQGQAHAAPLTREEFERLKAEHPD